MWEISQETFSPQLETQSVLQCPVCFGEGAPILEHLRDRLFDVSGEWTLWRCTESSCGCLWLNPRAADGAISSLYQSYFTHSGPNTIEDRSLAALIERAVHKKCLGLGNRVSVVSPLVGSLISAIHPLAEYLSGRVMWVQNSWRGRLLDVGCGAGDLLLRMKRYGWEVEGLEPDPIAADNLRKAGIKVTCGTFPNDQLEPESFDVITASHVIEHVADPKSFLSACFKILRPNGRLIVATPNARSKGFNRYGRSWVHLDAPRHLVLFTPEGLARSLDAASFSVERIRTSCRSAYFATKTSRRLQRGGMRIGFGAQYSLKDKTTAMAAFFIEGFFLPSQAGQEIVAVARKDRC